MLLKSALSENTRSEYMRYSILAFVLFLISPLISLPFILLSIYNRERFALFVLALFFGLLSYYLIPTWELDLSRYYFMYERMLKVDFNGFKQILIEQNDYVFFFIYYLFSRLNIGFQTFLLITSTLCFYSCFRVGDFVIRRFNPSRLSYFVLMGSFILSLPILAMLSVTRFSIAFVFFMLYVYNNLNNKGKTSFLFLILSCLTHFAFSVYIPFLILFYFFKNRIKINALLLGVGTFAILLSLTGGLMKLIQFIPFLAVKAETYLTVYEDTNIKILSFILIMPVFIALFFYTRFYKYVPSRMLQFFLGTLLVALVCLPTNMIIYDRYIQVFKPFLALTMIATYYNNKVFNREKGILLKKIVLVASIFYAMYYFYTFYIIYRESFRGFLSVGKLLLVSILDSTYSQRDFY